MLNFNHIFTKLISSILKNPYAMNTLALDFFINSSRLFLRDVWLHICYLYDV